MATLMKFARPTRILSSQLFKLRRNVVPSCKISTSDNNAEVEKSSNQDTIPKQDELKELEKHFADDDPQKIANWVSHRWSLYDREEDQFINNIAKWCFISLITCTGSFLLYYLPDFRGREWAMREAYLDMYRREKAGLPMIDPYYVPPETVILPTEEELGDTEIII